MSSSCGEQDEEEEWDAALSCDFLFRAKLPAVLPCPAGSKPKDPGPKKTTSITATAWAPTRHRLYVGLSNGDLCFWPLDIGAASQLRYVGSHKGPVTSVCLPKVTDGDLGRSGLLLSGSVDGNIKIWDYQGKVGSQPTVCVQTLYGHTGTITGLFTYDQYIVSSSTDCTVKVWKAVEGRSQLVYPWYNLHTTPLTLPSWVRAMSYGRSQEVGDLGSFWATAESGSLIRIVPQVIHDEGGAMKGFTFVISGSSPASHSGSISVASDVAPTIPVQHDRGVLLVKYVGDWHLVLTSCYDNCLRAYHETGELAHCWDNERKCLFLDMEVEVDSQEILAVDQRGTLSIFSLKAGTLIATKSITNEPIIKITAVLSKHMYALMTEKELTVWHLNHNLGYNMLRGGHTKAVLSLYACTGGAGAQPHELDHRIFSAGQDNTVRLWDPYDMACARVHLEEQNEISAMTFYESWNILITGHENGCIKLWDLDTGPWCTLQQHTNTVSSLVIALTRRNEELLISAGYDGVIVLWDIRTLRNEPPHMVAKFRAHGAEPQRAQPILAATVQVSGTSPLLGACTPTGELASSEQVEASIPALIPLYNVPPSTDTSACPTNRSSWSQVPHPGHTTAEFKPAHPHTRKPIPTYKPSPRPTVPSSTHLYGLAGHDDDTSSSSAEAALQRDAHDQPVLSGPQPDPKASSADAAGKAATQPATAALLDVLALEPEILVVRFDPIKKVIITAGNDRIIKVWSLNGYTQIGQHIGHTDSITSMTLDANLLFTGSEDCSIRVWDTVPATTTLQEPQSRTTTINGNAQGSTNSGKGEVIGLFTGTALKLLEGHTQCVTWLEVSPSGGHLISCSLDGSMRVWDYVAGVALAKFTHHEQMRCLTLRSDKPEVLIGTNQASILRYSIADVPATVLPSRQSFAGFDLQPVSHRPSMMGHDGVSGLRSLSIKSTNQPSLPAIKPQSAGGDGSSTIGTVNKDAGTRHVRTPGSGVDDAEEDEQEPASRTLEKSPSKGKLVGKLFSGAGMGGGDQGVWKWGSAKVQLLPKDAVKATDMLSAMDRQRGRSKQNPRS